MGSFFVGLKSATRLLVAAAVLGFAGGQLALAQNPLLEDVSEEEADDGDITATLTARAADSFALPSKVALEIGEDMVADQNLHAQALRSLNAAQVAVDGNAEMTLAIDFDVEPLGDTGRQVTGLGDRGAYDDRRIYSGDRDPYSGESYLREQDFGIAIGLGKRDRQALGSDYSLTARVYTLTGEVMWSGSVGAVIVGATPELVGEAMLEHLLKEMGNNVAAKTVVLAEGDSGSFGSQRPARVTPSGGQTRSRDGNPPPPVEPHERPPHSPGTAIF
mgnify:CR=1 FL=1